MNACLTEEERQHRTFHSKRVWLGSAFKHLKFSEGEIQALVHWRSEDSIRIYGRMDEIYQMNAREKAASASFTVMNASSFTVLRERGEIFSRSRAPDGGRAVALCRP